MNNQLYNNYNQISGPQSHYVDEYLRGNIGKQAEIHVSFADSIEWRDSIFTGIIDTVGKDYIVIRNNHKKHVIWSIYIDYIVIE